MKIKIVVLALSFIATMSVLALPADRFSPLVLTFSATATQNNSNVTTNGITATYPKPTSFKMSNSTLLAMLAADKFTEHEWLSNSFPKGAKIILNVDNDNVVGTFTYVADASGKELLNVQDLLQVSIGSAGAMSGKLNITNGRVTGFAYQKWAELNYNDSIIGGTTQFTVFGNDQETKSDTVKGLTYKETETHTINPALGTSVVGGVPTVLSASFSLSGSNVFPLN